MKLAAFSKSAVSRPLPFYLSMEECLARDCKEEAVMVWRVGPTVIIGRNQDASAEVRLEDCLKEGVEVYRRRSGGGAVYADADNVMISFIVDVDADVETAFARCSRLLADALRSMGVDAEPSGRNDIEVGGRKVSGGAFHLVGRRGIAHFTMLFDADPATMERLLTPPSDKLERHGVASVKARVTTLRPLLRVGSAAEFAAELGRLLSDGVIELPENMVGAVEQMAATYPNLALA